MRSKLLTRREFSKLSLGVAAGFGFGLHDLQGAEAGSKPNSKVAGVHIGLNVPYSFGGSGMKGDEILEKCVQLGISGLELRAQPVEIFLGAPEKLVYPKRGEGAPPAAEVAREMAAWRKLALVGQAADFRRNYERAGVFIEILKVDGIFKLSDEELDYMFAMAKRLGARAISSEISKKEEDLARVGKFANTHQLMVGYHGHASTKTEDFERAFALAKFNGANLDIGHFVAGNNGSPMEFLEKHHARVTHIHVKDRKKDNGGNTPFGEGDTPIKETLRLIRDKKWPIQATIEFEYRVPAGSDRLTEIAKALKYCREALAS